MDDGLISVDRLEATSERAKRGRDVLLSALKDDVVDTHYLDNTYCNPSYDFPTRQLAAQQVIDIIVSNPEHDIDTLGKEDLLIHISRVLKIKMWDWPERLRTIHLLGFHHSFTTNAPLTRVRAVPRYSFSIDTLEGLNRCHPTIGIMASGIPWVTKPLEKNENVFCSFLTYRYKRGKCSAHGGIQTVERFNQTFQSIDSASQLHNRHKRKGSGEREGIVCPEASYGGRNFIGSKRKRRSTLKVNSSGVRLCRLSISRRNRQCAKIEKNNSDGQSS